MKRISILFITCIFACAVIYAERFSTNFEKDSCPSDFPLKFYSYVDGFKIHLNILNGSEEIYRLDLGSSFIFIESLSWQTPFTDTHADRAATLFLNIPSGKLSLILYPKALIKETDEEWRGVHWLLWPCKKESPIPSKPYLGGAPNECDLQMILSFTNEQGKAVKCKMKAKLLTKKPSMTIEAYK